MPYYGSTAMADEGGMSKKAREAEVWAGDCRMVDTEV
jgi:hypothetical protein